MQLNNLKNKKRREKRVGRGGAHGKTSGRGTKGQRARSGHRIRPAERDLMMRIPKLRGYRNKPKSPKNMAINVGILEKLVPGNEVNKKILSSVLRLERAIPFKILGDGEVKKALTVTGLRVSKIAKEKIEKAGGSVK
ncbi:MAG: 50S ribosomal protein L15 [Candidatus Pacebacteria bacterium]|nr:50S ribosomal protein L15 [Candidatus Paceibacterota bacterium]